MYGYLCENVGLGILNNLIHSFFMAYQLSKSLAVGPNYYTKRVYRPTTWLNKNKKLLVVLCGLLNK